MIHKLAPDEGVSPANTLSRPKYDRSQLSAGIVHIGVGNFHRAHQAHYLHRLFNTGRDHDWAIVGAGIKSFDAAMRERLEQQDWQTTVMELDPAGFSATIVGSMVDFAPIDPQAIIEGPALYLRDPALRRRRRVVDAHRDRAVAFEASELEIAGLPALPGRQADVPRRQRPHGPPVLCVPVTGNAVEGAWRRIQPVRRRKRRDSAGRPDCGVTARAPFLGGCHGLPSVRGSSGLRGG